MILIGAPSNITGPGGSGSVYEIQGPATGTYHDSIATSEQYDCPAVYALVPHHGLEQRNAVGFGTSVSAYANGNGDFIAGGPGYTGTLPTTNNGTATATPLDGAAAMVLASLQPATP